VHAAIRRLGYRIPEDIRYIQLNRGARDGSMAGVRRDMAKECQVAVQWLIRELLSLRLSKFEETLAIVLEPRWQTGATFPEG